MSMRQPRLWPAVLLTAGALAVAGCGSGAQTSSGSSETSGAAASTAASAGAGSVGTDSGDGEVTVTVTEAGGCVASPNTVPAGQVTFVITNVDSLSVTEVELVADQRIVGERENLAPGFDSTFSARLDGGAYEVYCPGAATERTPFTVTGQATAQSADLTSLLDQATIDYGTYVDDQITFLLVPVQELAAAIKAGDLAAAQAAYVKARPFYERIEPVAESFPDLDPAIDLRIGDVEAGTTWTGFHPIEQGLFEKKSTEGLSELAEKLIADIQGPGGPGGPAVRGDRCRNRGRLPGVRDRERVGDAAGRGAGVEDHRRGGGVLADRPAGFRGRRGGVVSGLRHPEAGARPDRPDSRPADRHGFQRPHRCAGPVPGSEQPGRLEALRHVDGAGQEGADRRVARCPGIVVGHLGQDHQLVPPHLLPQHLRGRI